MDAAVPPGAFAWPFTVSPPMVDVQGRLSNHEVVRLLVETAARHSEHLGWDLEAYLRLGAWWVVRRHEVDYHLGAGVGDALCCLTWPSAVSKASAERRTVLRREPDGALVATALSVWALVDARTGRPRRIPPEILAAFDPAKWDPSPRSGRGSGFAAEVPPR